MWQAIEKAPGRKGVVLIMILLHAYSHNTNQSQFCPHPAITEKREEMGFGGVMVTQAKIKSIITDW